jgi:ComF family protein
MLQYLRDVFELAFPNNCVECRKTLFNFETTICSSCLESLPRTHFEKQADNTIVRLFWGRCELEMATSLFYINKHNKVHHLMHQLKYRNKPLIGQRLGKTLGLKLIEEGSLFSGIDMIVPVPLHWKKEQQRGYNQALQIALGIQQATQWKVEENNLVRVKENISQTKRTKYERWENVSEIFEVKNPEAIQHKHILLVDDVITTGATLEACVHALKKVEGVKVSVASLATVER